MTSPISSLGALVGNVGSVGGTRPLAPSNAAAATQGADFGQVLADVATEAIDNLKAGEAAAISGIQGQASVQKVVEAIMTAEQSLHMAVAIRDKVVSAYQEISRMTI
jgi:flagellar hook-basal body complex protein FliE